MPYPANRPDLVYAAYAVARGFTINPGRVYVDADYVRGIPRDTLHFTLGEQNVWLTALGWRVGRLDTVREVYDRPREDREDFSNDVLTALERALERHAAQQRDGAVT